MKILKNKRKAKCRICGNKIELKYRVKEKGYYHLRCYYNWLKKELDNYKGHFKELNKLKYKRQMLLEGLS